MSTLRVNTLQNAAGVEVYTAKAWVNFNGTGTVAIRASGNVSSITDNGTGDYTVNFTTALADANYAVTGAAAQEILSSPRAVGLQGTTPTTTTARIVCGVPGASFNDCQFIGVSIFR
jgi:hypothetical protein